MDREDTGVACPPSTHITSLSTWVFFCLSKIQEKATTAIYEITKYIAQHGKSFSESIFIKESFISVAEMSLGKVLDFNKVRIPQNIGVVTYQLT